MQNTRESGSVAVDMYTEPENYSQQPRSRMENAAYYGSRAGRAVGTVLREAARYSAYAAATTAVASTGLAGPTAKKCADYLISKSGPVFEYVVDGAVKLVKNLYDGYCSMR